MLEQRNLESLLSLDWFLVSYKLYFWVLDEYNPVITYEEAQFRYFQLSRPWNLVMSSLTDDRFDISVYWFR